MEEKHVKGEGSTFKMFIREKVKTGEAVLCPWFFVWLLRLSLSYKNMEPRLT